MRERLQKLIARAGVTSRRTAESLILAGSVRVNGRLVTRLGSKADPETDTITVEGRRLRFPDRPAYYLLHKPRGTVCTTHDPEGRPTIFSRLGRLQERVFPVGRLPFDVDGLLLLTNDGGFADALLRGGLPQTYRLKIKGRLSVEEIAKVRERIARAPGGASGLREVRRGPNPWYEAILTDPSTDRVRSLLFRLGHPVEKMSRVGIGSLQDPKLPAGRFRSLTEAERARLLGEAGARRPRHRQRRPRKTGRRRIV